MLGLRKKVRVCQRWSPGGAGGQGATHRPDSEYDECVSPGMSDMQQNALQIITAAKMVHILCLPCMNLHQ